MSEAAKTAIVVGLGLLLGGGLGILIIWLIERSQR
jgi:uncharacterized membrane protein YjgN (DUF898 family)